MQVGKTHKENNNNNNKFSTKIWVLILKLEKGHFIIESTKKSFRFWKKLLNLRTLLDVKIFSLSDGWKLKEKNASGSRGGMEK